MAEPLIILFAHASDASPTERLEDRVKRFLEAEPSTESLDAEAFNEVNGSETKADYLLGRRSFVAELKTLNGDPLDRVERRVKERFSQPGSPLVYGTMGSSRVLDGLPDRDAVLRTIHDLSSRAVRRHLQKANEQVSATKERLNIPSAAGLAVLLNDSEPMIDAANIGYSVIRAAKDVPGGYPAIDFIWASIESTKIRLPDGRTGYPQLLICRERTPSENQLDFLVRMVGAWARFNGSVVEQINHRGDWETMAPVYDGQPPTMSLY
jgi:hypothetical protein